MRYAISCEAIQDKEFCVRTNNKTVLLSADSGKSRDEWVKAVKKVIFKAQNSGDSVKVCVSLVDNSALLIFSFRSRFLTPR